MCRAFTIFVLVAVSMAVVSASRECYVCNSDDHPGHKSSKACKKDTFDTTVVPVIRVPQSEKECYVCYKFVNDNDHVNRGCLTKKDYKDHKDTFKFKGQDDCKKDNGNEFCICQNNYCNGAVMISMSLLTVTAGALLKMLF